MSDLKDRESVKIRGEPLMIDWDELENQRVAIFPTAQHRRLLAA